MKRKRSESLPPVSEAYQAFIDVLNKSEHRDTVMNAIVSRKRSNKWKWAGSFFVAKAVTRLLPPETILYDDLPSTLARICDSKSPVCFTMAHSGRDAAHHVAFMFYPGSDSPLEKSSQLFSFDPRKGIYYGGNLIIQRVSQAMTSLEPSTVCEDLSINDGRNGCMQSGGDSFCQTWSLLFLRERIRTESFEFLDLWKSMDSNGKKRVITEFILEILDDNIETIDAEANFELQNEYRKPGHEVADVLRADLS